MGSGSSKVVIKKVENVDFSAINGAVEVEDATNAANEKPVDGPQPEQESNNLDQANDNNTVEICQEAMQEEPQEIHVKPVSETLKETEEKLKEKGFTDSILARYCDETPSLFDDFVTLFENLKKIKKNLKSDFSVSSVGTYYKRISNLYENTRPEKIKRANLLAELGFGETSKDVFDKLVSLHPKLLTYDREEDKENKDDESLKPLLKAQDMLASYLIVVINYTDLCHNLCIEFDTAGMVKRLLDMVENTKDCAPFHEKYLDDNGSLSKKYVRGDILSRSLGTLHNLSKRVQTRKSFAACNAEKILLPITEDKVTFFATKALLILAYLIDESNNEMIMANKGPIKFLISGLEKAITKSSKHRYLGFSSAELAEGLAQIAINDTNKKTIVDNNVLPILKKMIKKAVRDEEIVEAAGLIWVLAFDEDNRIKISETEGLIDLIKTLRDHDNDEVKKAVSGALWELEGKQSGVALPDLNQSNAGKVKHVMISYQWDVQSTLIKVKNRLQSSGYKVWMDLEQMGGSTLEAMARAVENASVVLVCVSQKYKESSNCRSEAEYAFQLKKDIVPLMMETNYRADGWLGMVMGSKLWIDFSHGQKKMDASFRDLVKELGVRGKMDNPDMIEATAVDMVDALPVPEPKIDISGWKNNDVMKWIRSFGLEVKKNNLLDKLDGDFLTRLHALRIESPEFYYASLKNDIGLFDICSVLSFTDELDKLVG